MQVVAITGVENLHLVFLFPWECGINLTLWLTTTFLLFIDMLVALFT